MSAVAVDLDAVLGDTRPLWEAWLADVDRVLDVGGLPDDRAAAAAELDRRGAGNWRALLQRFAEERVPVHLRPRADVTIALRRLYAGGVPVGAFTDAPRELAAVAVAHLGATRRLSAIETGAGARERLLDVLGHDTIVVRTRAELAELAQAPSV